MAQTFPKSTPAAEMQTHRRAWATGVETVHEVISRDGKTRYEVALLTDGTLRCPCQARGHCWHMDKVAARILREGVPESIVKPRPTADELFDRL